MPVDCLFYYQNLFQTHFCGWGVVAMENISKGDFIIEYIGEGKLHYFFLLNWHFCYVEPMIATGQCNLHYVFVNFVLNTCNVFDE